MMKKNIRLLVVGDQSVGKSTLISTIYSELSTNQRTLRRVILPPEMCLYSKDMFTELIDTSVDMDLRTEIQQSDLVLLIYDISDPQTIQRLETVWLPKISSIKPKISVILVGNKIDIKEHQYESQHEYIKVKDILKKVSRQYKNVQMGIQCSAFYDRNVKSVLNCAQRAVLYPLSPLYNLEQKKITLDFRKALIRIFRILDKDFDGKLYDSQMSTLQQRVFNSQLNIQDIKAIKQIITRQLKVDYHDYIELTGFIALQKKCIDMLKIQICWSILRYFHYNDNLRIIVKNQHFHLADYETIQLSNQAIDFLLKLFHYVKQTLNKDKEGSMQMNDSSLYSNNKQSELISEIFASSPCIRLPEFEGVEEITQQKFLINWWLYSFIDYAKCYEDLLYLGYQKGIDETFVKRPKKKTYKTYEKMKQNKVFSVIIVSCDMYSSYIDSFFQDGQKIMMSNGHSYMRNSVLYTGQGYARVFLLFKVDYKDLQTFFEHDEETKNFGKRIDILVDFEANQRYAYMNEQQQIFPEKMLYRKITKKDAQQVLMVLEPLQLNLDNFPVDYSHKHQDKFLELIISSCQQFNKYMSKRTMEHLKNEQQKSNKMIVLSAAGISVGLVILGSFLVKKGILSGLKTK